MQDLIALLRDRRAVALTGAGCSTASGIPDYRGAGRPTRRPPIQHHDFVTSEATRRRYWARAVVGWPVISTARPNPAHHALVALERAGRVNGVITQNVDGLHGAAGSARLVELHGALARVRCLGCDARTSRADVQARMLAANPGWPPPAVAAPDGDANLADDAVAAFVVVACEECGGVLKPDVVFFGDNVARPVVEAAYGLLDDATAIVVAGSSLTVFSGYRFVKRAAERGVPVAIVNRGPTRGDPLATIRLDVDVGHALSEVAAALS